MADPINKPPFNQPIVDKNGYITRTWQRYIDREHRKTGGTSPILPVELGGTGESTIAGFAAAQGEAATTTAPTSLTQSKTVALNSLGDDSLGSFEDTTIAWDAAFADAIYTPYVSGVSLRFGTVDYLSQTATDITVRLTNSQDGRTASGSVTVTGVHA